LNGSVAEITSFQISLLFFELACQILFIATQASIFPVERQYSETLKKKKKKKKKNGGNFNL
jgi:hypothetical protein